MTEEDKTMHWMIAGMRAMGTGMLEFYPRDLPLVCEDHQDRTAKYSLAGASLLCEECAKVLSGDGHPVAEITDADIDQWLAKPSKKPAE